VNLDNAKKIPFLKSKLKKSTVLYLFEYRMAQAIGQTIKNER